MTYVLYLKTFLKYFAGVRKYARVPGFLGTRALVGKVATAHLFLALLSFLVVCSAFFFRSRLLGLASPTGLFFDPGIPAVSLSLAALSCRAAVFAAFVWSLGGLRPEDGLASRSRSFVILALAVIPSFVISAYLRRHAYLFFHPALLKISFLSDMGVSLLVGALLFMRKSPASDLVNSGDATQISFSNLLSRGLKWPAKLVWVEFSISADLGSVFSSAGATALFSPERASFTRWGGVSGFVLFNGPEAGYRAWMLEFLGAFGFLIERTAETSLSSEDWRSWFAALWGGKARPETELFFRAFGAQVPKSIANTDVGTELISERALVDLARARGARVLSGEQGWNFSSEDRVTHSRLVRYLGVLHSRGDSVSPDLQKQPDLRGFIHLNRGSRPSLLLVFSRPYPADIHDVRRLVFTHNLAEALKTP